jgi:predicted lysophospholipase L1 biosynthesis ABC-type transport system permease subunit
MHDSSITGNYPVMTWLVVLLVLAVIFGVIGLAVEALKWFIIIAGILIVVAIIQSAMRSRTRP